MTIRAIINDAFREANIIPVGGTVEGEEFDEALRRLNSLYKSLLGHELGDPLKTINADKITSPLLPNLRVMEPDINLTLSKLPRDGARLEVKTEGSVVIDGNGRDIEGGGTVTVPADTIRQWFYRDDLGEWVRVTDLAAEDESPLPGEFDDALITLMAFRLNPRYGAITSDNMVMLMREMRSRLRARYFQPTQSDAEEALLRLPSSRRWFFDKWERGANA